MDVILTENVLLKGGRFLAGNVVSVDDTTAGNLVSEGLGKFAEMQPEVSKKEATAATPEAKKTDAKSVKKAKAGKK